jgi:hypothetical protein
MTTSMDRRLSKLEGPASEENDWLVQLVRSQFPDEPPPRTQTEAMLRYWQYVSDSVTKGQGDVSGKH